jgi:hypothetical protein
MAPSSRSGPGLDNTDAAQNARIHKYGGILRQNKAENSPEDGR